MMEHSGRNSFFKLILHIIRIYVDIGLFEIECKATMKR